MDWEPINDRLISARFASRHCKTKNLEMLRSKRDRGHGMDYCIVRTTQREVSKVAVARRANEICKEFAIELRNHFDALEMKMECTRTLL